VEGFAGPCLSHSATSPVVRRTGPIVDPIGKAQPTHGSLDGTVICHRADMTPVARQRIRVSSPRRFATAVLAVGALVLAACGSGDGDTDADSAATDSTAMTPETTNAPDTTAAPTTTTPAVDPATAYVEAGDHPVGVTTLQLAAGNQVEVWYPAVEGSTGSETYDVRDFVPETIRALLTGDAPATYTYDAARDADVAEGAFPVVLFSHGYSGMRLQSTFLTAHLASHGMIVVSPDHWNRDLYHVLSAPVGDRSSSITELLQSLELITAAGDNTSSPFGGHVDADRVVAVGHSAGGGTVVGAAADDRIDAYVSMASGALGMGGQSTTTAPPSLPDKPSFFLAGALDAVVSPETATRPSFEAVPAPSRLWIIDGVGHNGFDDFCTFGNGQGIIGVAMASGLGPTARSQAPVEDPGRGRLRAARARREPRLPDHPTRGHRADPLLVRR